MVSPRLSPAQRSLVQANAPLAKYLARIAWSKNREQMELDEVVSVAYQGLVTAALKFDPHSHGMSQETIDNGRAFSAFARTKIVGTIIDWQRSNDHVQRSVRADHKKLIDAGLATDDRDGPPLEVLAVRTGLSLDRVMYVLRLVRLRPMNLSEFRFDERVEGVRTSEDQSFERSLNSDQTDIESSAVERQVTSTVASALSQLPELHQLIVVLRYYSGHELQTIAVELGVNLTTVREAHSEAVLLLHSAMLHKVRDGH